MGGPSDDNGLSNARRRAQAAGLAVLLLGGTALAASQRDRDDCASGVAERVIAGCTRVIDDPSESAAERVVAHERRGFVHLDRRNLDAAIADFSAALRDDSGRAFSLYGRGMARIFSGDAAGQNEMESAVMMRPQVEEEFRRYGKK